MIHGPKLRFACGLLADRPDRDLGFLAQLLDMAGRLFALFHAQGWYADAYRRRIEGVRAQRDSVRALTMDGTLARSNGVIRMRSPCDLTAPSRFIGTE